MKCNWKECDNEIKKGRKFCSQSCNAKDRNSKIRSNFIDFNIQRSIRTEKEYLDNPNICPSCNNIIEYNKRRNKFCNHKCSAFYHNSKCITPQKEKNISKNPWTEERRRLWGIKMKNRIVNYHIWTEEEKESARQRSKKINKEYWTEERRIEQSQRMKRIIQENPESYSSKNVCGRNKQIEYNGIRLNSSWELIVVKWFEENGIFWKRNEVGFKYYWEEKQKYHTYFPDFYLPDSDRYVEVKGYETDRDRCKWKVVENLRIIKKKEIEQIKNLIFEL